MGVSRRQFVSGMASAGAGVALAGPASVLGYEKPPGSASLVLYNGDALTLNKQFKVVQAVAIADGRVLKTGTNASMKDTIGPNTQVVNLRGRTALPGFNDAHLHGASFGTSLPPYTYDVGYPAALSIADMVQIVAGAVQAAQPGAWIRGRGWNANFFPEGRRPTRHDLDPVSPNNPVRLSDFSGHAVLVNTVALQRAGITRDTPAPTGGIIVKDANGEPTGELLESAQSLVTAPPFTAAERTAAMQNGLRLLSAEGITSFTDPGGSLQSYSGMLSNGTLNQRVTVLMGAPNNAPAMANRLATFQPPAEADPHFLHFAGFKIFADGVAASRTSWMYPPGYVDGTGTGSLVVAGDTDEERVATLEEIIRLVHAAGFQAAVHTTGNRSNDAVVEAMIKAMTAHPRPDPRHTTHHHVFTSRETLQRMGRYGIRTNLNPNIMWMINESQTDIVGEELAEFQFPYRSALDAGVKVASGSDAAVAYPSVRQGIASAVLREGQRTGAVVGPNERISLEEALRTYTTSAAAQDFAEGWKGSLEPGMAADICVLDGPMLRVNPREIPDMEVAMTIVDGRVVFDDESSDEASTAGRKLRKQARKLSWSNNPEALIADDAHGCWSKNAAAAAGHGASHVH
jgi:predicted amidohydrolase YtcJ